MRGTCPNCGFSLKLSSKEKGNRIRRGLLFSQSCGYKIGRPSKVDINKLKLLYAKIKTINGTAKAYGVSRWTVRRYCK